MDEPPKDERPEGGLPPELRFLRGLVTGLTVVMIAGVITIVALLVIRLNQAPPPILTVAPQDFALPEGVQATGISTAGPRHVMIAGDDGMIRIYDVESRDLVQEVPIEAD